jgi:heptosyltransferase-2
VATVVRGLSGDPATWRSILVRAPNWLGDLVMSTPALRALRVACPGASVTVWVREGLEDVLAGSPDVDRVLPLARVGRSPRAMAAAARTARGAGGYDLGLCLPDSFSSALLMRGAGARPVVGYRRGGRGPLLDVAVSAEAHRLAGGFVARELHGLGLLRAIGIDAVDTTLSLATTPVEEGRAAALLAEQGVGADEVPLVGLAPGASYGPSKCWPPERFAAVGDALAGDGARVLLLGSSSEVERCAAVAATMRKRSFDLSGRLDVGTLKAVVRRLGLLVCNDAGARHVAVAFGVPCVVLFGPTSVAKTPLNIERVAVVERDDPCRPCYRRHCPIDHRCLAGIEAGRVIGLARARLHAAGGATDFPLHHAGGPP